MTRRLWLVLVVLPHVLHRVRRAYYLRWTCLSFWRPHCQAGEETAMGYFEFLEGIGGVTAVGKLGRLIARVATGKVAWSHLSNVDISCD